MFWRISGVVGMRESKKVSEHNLYRLDIRLRVMFLAIGLLIMLSLRPWIAKQTYIRGGIFYNAGMYKKAIRYFKKSIILAPAYGCANLFLASSYEELGNYPEAIKVYLSYMKIVPQNPQIYYFLGSLYATRYKNYVKALGWFDVAIKVDKKYWEAYLWRGICWELLGRPDLAIASYQQMKKAFPRDRRIDGFIQEVKVKMQKRLR